MGFKEDPSPRKYLLLQENPLLFMEFNDHQFAHRNTCSAWVLEFATLKPKVTYKNSVLLLVLYTPRNILNYNFSSSFLFPPPNFSHRNYLKHQSDQCLRFSFSHFLFRVVPFLVIKHKKTASCSLSGFWFGFLFSDFFRKDSQVVFSWIVMGLRRGRTLQK